MAMMPTPPGPTTVGRVVDSPTAQLEAAATQLAVPRGDVAVVIPAFNEAASVGWVVTRVRAHGLTAVVVDDGSRDATATCASAAGAVTLSLPFNLGVGAALHTGFRWAKANGYSTVVHCDADGQHDPDEIEHLLRDADERDLHLLIGNRFSTEDGFRSTALRRLPIKVLAHLASRACGTALHDPTSGFRVIRDPLLS